MCAVLFKQYPVAQHLNGSQPCTPLPLDVWDNYTHLIDSTLYKVALFEHNLTLRFVLESLCGSPDPQHQLRGPRLTRLTHLVAELKRAKL